jgi:molybdate transport system substrate-binding protein
MRDHPGMDVRVTYGSSGNFYSQLSNHAPFDLFLSADQQYVQRLLDQGVALKGSDFVYATGRIVLWVPKSSPLEISKRGLEALREGSIRKIAIANPAHAPYGRAAEAALRAHGLWDAVQGKLVLGENIAQAAQFAQSGSVDAAILALSLVNSPSMKDSGRWYAIPQNDYPQLKQTGVVLTWARDPNAAGEFRQFITGTEGRAILERFGFGLPQRENTDAGTR